jgi:Domain of unknown function (DUF4112)
MDAALALMVARNCEKIDGGLPRGLSMLMLLNVLLDFVIGFVPFVGDFADALYKCNTRNAVLLEKYLRQKAAKQEKAGIKNQSQLPADPSDPEEFDKYDDELDEPPPADQENRPPGITPNTKSRDTTVLPKPPPAKVSQNNHRWSGWFGGSKQRQEDVEMGDTRNV